MPEVKDLKSHHRTIMMAMVVEGLTQREAAHRFNLSEQQISILVNSPLWKREENALRDRILGDYKNQVSQLVPDAIKCFKDVVKQSTQYEIQKDPDKPPEKVNVVNPPASRLKAAQHIMEYAGMGVENKDEKKSIHIQLYRPKWAEGDGEVIDIEV